MILAVVAAALLSQGELPGVTQPAGAVAPSAAAQSAAQPTGSAGELIQAGLVAFKARRLKPARAKFEDAVAADPQSAAAAYYLGYTLYKMGEPSRRMNPDKQRARELFAKAFSLDPGFKPFGK